MEMVEKMIEKEKIDIFRDIWRRDNKKLMRCPRCGGSLSIVNMQPTTRKGSLRLSYETFIECENCSFSIRANAFTVLGAIKNFNEKTIDISSWSPTGVREIESFDHSIDTDLLREISSSGDLVEFLVIDNQVVAIID